MQESPHAFEMHILENFFACLACLTLQNLTMDPFRVLESLHALLISCRNSPGRKILSIEKILPDFDFFHETLQEIAGLVARSFLVYPSRQATESLRQVNLSQQNNIDCTRKPQ